MKQRVIIRSDGPTKSQNGYNPIWSCTHYYRISQTDVNDNPYWAKIRREFAPGWTTFILNMIMVVWLKGYMAFWVISFSYVFLISIPFIPWLFLYIRSLLGTDGFEFSGSTPSNLVTCLCPLPIAALLLKIINH